MDEHNPIYVDLDGTLIKTDLLYESFIKAVKENPLVLFFCFAWLFKGIAYLKYKLAFCADVDTSLMPLNKQFYEFLNNQKEQGRKLLLATASNEILASRIVEQHPIFDGYLASSKSENLKGHKKLEKIRKQTTVFSYAGNSSEDFVIFDEAKESYLVNPTASALRKSGSVDFSDTFDIESTGLISWMKQLRVHQWLKNVLIFVPLLVSGNYLHFESVSNSLLAFIAFSFLASATYIINDLLDLESDRQHKRKRSRPLAAGKIGIFSALAVAAFLFLGAFLIALSTNYLFTLTLLLYLGITLSYSFSLKAYFGIDVIVLASLYTIRIFAGAYVIDVAISFWLLSFSMFVFLSLALVKRCAELKSLQLNGAERAKGRDYSVDDYPLFVSFGTSSAFLAVLMFCLYINSEVMSDKYHEPSLLWLLIPMLCYWLMRMWVKTGRGEMHDDPIVFSLKDRGSVFTIATMGILTVVAQVFI